MSDIKPVIIAISFKTATLDDIMLLDWLEPKFKEYGKSNYIKQILRKQMLNELKDKDLCE